MAGSNTEEFLKIQRLRYQQEIKNIHQRQEMGLYPTQFSFPLAVQFEVTAKCNMHCKHCYNASAANRESQMTIENWKDVVQDIIQHGGIFQSIISGGEPLMIGSRLAEIMDPLHDDGTGFILITNGLLVNQKWIDLLKRYRYYWVQVSIDHLIPQKHDDFREKEGSWQKAVNAALMFSSAGFPLRIAHSLTPESLDYLPEFTDFVYKLGASTLVCGEVFLSGRVAEHPELLMTPQDKDRMHKIICELQKEYRGKLHIYPSADEKLDMLHHQQIPNDSCIIRPDGSVRLDCTMPFTMGNVLQKPFSEIWRTKGNQCWTDPEVTRFIQNFNTCDLTAPIINHVTPDREI